MIGTKQITVYAKSHELARESASKTHPGYRILSVKYECLSGDACGNIEYTVTLKD